MPKLQSNFLEITLRYGCSPANLLHISPFPRNTSVWLHCKIIVFILDQSEEISLLIQDCSSIKNVLNCLPYNVDIFFSKYFPK